MRKNIFLISVLCLSCVAGNIAQDVHSLNGLEESDSLYVLLNQIDTAQIRAGQPKPPVQFSLREQVHIHVFDQGYIPACVGYAIASAVAIRLNTYCNSICECEKVVAPFSAAFIYNQISGGQPRGISLTRALDTLERQGICPEAVFANDRYSAAKQPDIVARRTARQFCFWKAERIIYLPVELTNDDERHTTMMKLLQAEISNSIPVIV
jgi:hypothetical protein